MDQRYLTREFKRRMNIMHRHHIKVSDVGWTGTAADKAKAKSADGVFANMLACAKDPNHIHVLKAEYYASSEGQARLARQEARRLSRYTGTAEKLIAMDVVTPEQAEELAQAWRASIDRPFKIMSGTEFNPMNNRRVWPVYLSDDYEQ